MPLNFLLLYFFLIIALSEVRCQLVDQLKLLDLQLEQKSQQLQDLTDYLRRRGEIESEYSRSLEKLAERFTQKIKRYISSFRMTLCSKPGCTFYECFVSFSSLHFYRKEPSNSSVAQVWLTLLSETRQESRDHNGLSESCSTFLIQPLAHCLEYTQRLAKKVLIQALAHKPQSQPCIMHMRNVCPLCVLLPLLDCFVLSPHGFSRVKTSVLIYKMDYSKLPQSFRL